MSDFTDNGVGNLKKLRISICSNWEYCLLRNKCFYNKKEAPKFCGFNNSEKARKKYKEYLENK